MKLYAWQPRGYGEYSLFVMAKTEKQARKAVDTKIAALLKEAENDDCFEWYSESDFKGWGTDHYRLTVVGEGEVVLNANN